MQLHQWPTHFQILSRLANEGVVNPKDRYNYQKIAIDDGIYFHKEARNIDVGGLLSNELLWADFMEQFAAAHPALNVRGLEVYAYRHEESIITEFMEAPLLVTPDTIQSIEPVLKRYIQLLVAFDDFAADYQPEQPGKQIWTVYNHLDKGWQNWIERGGLLEKGVLSAEELVSAQQLVQNVTLEPRFQHGDLVPWHFFNQNDTWISFDAEHTSRNYPRFYDLIYSYTRFYTRGKNRKLADQLMQGFFEQSGLSAEDFFAAIHPVLMSRTVGVLLDAENDSNKIDYRPEAKELFTRALHATELGDLIPLPLAK